MTRSRDYAELISAPVQQRALPRQQGDPMNGIAATQFLALSTPTAVSWLAYIIIGGIAGWLASKIVRGGGSGILIDIVVGIIGGYIGGTLLSWLNVDVEHGRRWFTFFTALLGAIILLFVVRLVRGAVRRYPVVAAVINGLPSEGATHQPHDE